MTSQGSSQRTRHAVVMGLGVASRGAPPGRTRWRVLVTDLRERMHLASIDALQGDAIELRLGEHREEDPERAELWWPIPVDPATLLEAARGRRTITSELELGWTVEGRPVSR